MRRTEYVVQYSQRDCNQWYDYPSGREDHSGFDTVEAAKHRLVYAANDVYACDCRIVKRTTTEQVVRPRGKKGA
jgi:hypothetical protein